VSDVIHVRILLPSEIYVDKEASKVCAEAANGEFCLLPRHVDFLAPLVPGILTLTNPRGEDSYFAVDSGILVKRAREVFISTERAYMGPDLGELRRRVEEEFEHLEETEQRARTTAAKLEAALVKRFAEAT